MSTFKRDQMFSLQPDSVHLFPLNKWEVYIFKLNDTYCCVILIYIVPFHHWMLNVTKPIWFFSSHCQSFETECISQKTKEHKVAELLTFIVHLLLLGHTHSTTATSGGLGVLTAHTQTTEKKKEISYMKAIYISTILLTRDSHHHFPAKFGFEFTHFF